MATKKNRSEMNPEELAALRKTEAAKRKAYRDAEKEERELAEARRQSTTLEQHWQIQLRTPPANYTELLARQERVFDMCDWMRDHISGSYMLVEQDPAYLGVEEGRTTIEEDVRNHGLCATEITLLPQFWLDKRLTHLITGTSPTSIFGRYGLVTAIPSKLFYEWTTFLQKRNAKPQPKPAHETVKMMCTNPTCKNPIARLGESVPQSIAKDYEARGMKYLCYQCRDEWKADKAKFHDSQQAARLAGQVYDSYGRFKDE